jgi:hypothetical protein
MTTRAKITAAAAAVAMTALLAACGQGQFWGPPAPPPPRPHAIAGPEYAAAVAYLKAHPPRSPKGMEAGLLVSESSPGYVCAGYCHTWHGTVVVPGGWVENLSSRQGDNGMASLARVVDVIAFPAGNVPVDAPGDTGNVTPARVLVAGALAGAR